MTESHKRYSYCLELPDPATLLQLDDLPCLANELWRDLLPIRTWPVMQLLLILSGRLGPPSKHSHASHGIDHPAIHRIEQAKTCTYETRSYGQFFSLRLPYSDIMNWTDAWLETARNGLGSNQSNHCNHCNQTNSITTKKRDLKQTNALFYDLCHHAQRYLLRHRHQLFETFMDWHEQSDTASIFVRLYKQDQSAHYATLDSDFWAVNTTRCAYKVITEAIQVLYEQSQSQDYSEDDADHDGLWNIQQVYMCLPSWAKTLHLREHGMELVLTDMTEDIASIPLPEQQYYGKLFLRSIPVPQAKCTATRLEVAVLCFRGCLDLAKLVQDYWLLPDRSVPIPLLFL